MTRRSFSFASTTSLALLVPLVPLSLIACGAKVTVDLGPGAAAGTGGTTATGLGTSSGGNATTDVSSSSSTTTSTTSTTTSSSSSSTTTSSGSTCPGTPPLTGPCTPGAACGSNGSTCAAHVDQAGSGTPGFRMAQIDFNAPSVFVTGIVANVIQGNATPNDPACNLNGMGTLSWLLRFDISAGTMETGGAKPGTYSFVDEMLTQGSTTFHVQPVTVNGPLTSMCGFVSSPADVIIPIFLDAGGSQVVLLPLRGLQIGGSTSADLGCIGRYNAKGLDPANNCLPDSLHSAFVDGGKLAASIRLEDADTVVVGALNESLCVLLSGNAPAYGMQGPAGVLVCKRDGNGHIVFQGDFCSTTNQPGGCADAMQVAATFAAQAVKIQ